MDESGIPKKASDMEQVVRPPMMFYSRIEFPQFDGSNPQSWVKKCSKYFSLCKISQNQKVELASLYMVGRVAIWYNGYALTRHNIIWEDFVMDIYARFRDDLAVRWLKSSIS